MAALVYKDAVIVTGGSDITAELNELSIEYGAEQLDGTTFGNDTRVNKGGLLVANITVGGLVTFGDQLAEDILFDGVGDDDTIVAVFPGGVTEGSPTGYAMQCMVPEFTMGGAVGVLTPFNASFTHQGGL